MNTLEEQIVTHGGLKAAISILGPTSKGELTKAYEAMRERAPEAMRGSPEHVVIWASLQKAWESALALNDTKEQRAILKQREDMIMRLH